MVLEFGLLQSGLFPTTDAQGEGMSSDILEKIRQEAGTGVVPIGSIVPWCKTLAGVPQTLASNWKECDGTAITDSESPMVGQNAPALNNNNYFVRANTTSGGTGGSSSHSHNLSGGAQVQGAAHIYAASTNSKSHIPPYYDVVWIMRTS